MASRHPIPAFELSDVGSDDQRVIPKLYEPFLVKFSADMNVNVFIENISRSNSIRIDAAAGAGKSTRMPVALCKGLGKLVVHCVPSRLLAVHLHDYMVDNNDVPRALVTEVLDEYPGAGIVYTSSAAFCAQAARWKSKGVDPGVILYLDECHESDAATEVMRNLRHLMPGVSKYIEASATFGSGDISSRFDKPKMPSKTSVGTYNFLPAKDWDLNSVGTPWYAGDVNGNILVYTDSDEDASILMAKYRSVGFVAHRLTAKTKVDDFRNIMREVDELEGKVSAVLILDYAFRSGFTFKCSRILDFGRVGTVMLAHGRTARSERRAFNFEIYQTINRGARLVGRDCSYVMDHYEVQNTRVLLDGAESEIACFWYRIFGYCVPHYMRNLIYADGMVCRSFIQVMRGEEVMSMYKADCEWPVGAVDDDSVESVSPVSVAFPQGFDPVVDTDSSFRGRTPSVFSLADDAEDVSNMSESAFREQHRRSVRRGKSSMGRERPPPLPEPMPAHKGVKGTLYDLEMAMNRMGGFAKGIEQGAFYRAKDPNIAEVRVTSRFCDGVNAVFNSAGSMAMKDFLFNLDPGLRDDAVAVALRDYNTHQVRIKATSAAVLAFTKRFKELDVWDVEGTKDWMRCMRDMLTSSEAMISRSSEVMNAYSPQMFDKVHESVYAEEMNSVMSIWFKVLGTCVKGLGVEGAGYSLPHPTAVGMGHMNEICDKVACYNNLSGRFKMHVSGSTFRDKLVRMIMSGRPVEADVVAV
nr:DExH helicase [Fusarium asiaticum vivivirus 1]